MAIIFKEEGHIYESNDQDKINWTSVTSFIAMFKPKFDRDGQAKKSSKNKRSKWYGMTPKEILTSWDNETSRANWVIGIIIKEKQTCLTLKLLNVMDL